MMRGLPLRRLLSILVLASVFRRGDFLSAKDPTLKVATVPGQSAPLLRSADQGPKVERPLNLPCHTADEWKSRSIYQLVVDRFAPGDSISLWCGDRSSYCGGTFDGVTRRLDYIQGMGFDAISISPIIENVEGGYHGYWPKDFFNLNSHFGSANSLKKLVQACHARGMWVMVDVVMNHMGGPTNQNISDFYPFNDLEYYHECYYKCCGNCGVCSSDIKNCKEEKPFTTENCRLAPPFFDLNQSHPFVEERLIDWVHWAIAEFGFDGLRFDAVKHVSKAFWRKLKSTSPCFFLGDVAAKSPCFLASYQSGRAMNGLLDYPTASTLLEVFGKAASMKLLTKQVRENRRGFENGSTALLGTFLDSHVMPRFLSVQPNRALLKGALAWTFLSGGIPIIYYGTEQGFSGYEDPANREPLWYTGLNPQTELYLSISRLQSVRKKYSVWEHELVQVHAEERLYIFRKGPLLVVMSNNMFPTVFKGVLDEGFKGASTLCDVLAAEHGSDCLDVRDSRKEVRIRIPEYGTKVYAPVGEAVSES